tara:strand:+ start:23 stop:337 length:315 start_codon:yes stop_codon:yes gene_type:complete
MSGIFGGGSRAPQQTVQQVESKSAVSAAQSRADERASSSEAAEMKGVQKRSRLRRTGGQRMLFSPFRTEGPNQKPEGMSDAQWALMQQQRKKQSLGGTQSLGGS